MGLAFRHFPHVGLALKFIIMQEQKVEEQTDQSHFGKFNIFLLTKTAQNSFGLKNGDYARYRRYCSNKVLKLRHRMGVKFGTKMKFIKKDLLKQKPEDRKILQVFLFNAQKNWAFASQTKFSAARKASQKARARFYSIKKLVKAIEWAKRLHAICLQKSDHVTQLEAQAYQLFLEGSLEFQRQNWAKAQSKLIACRQIIPDLAKVSDSLSEKVFKQKVDQIQQTIKFCNFKISKGRELSITEIVELRKGGDDTLASLMDNLAQKWMSNIKLSENHGEIYFGEERYPIKQELIIQQKAKIQASESNLDQFKNKWISNMADQKLFEQLLSLYSEHVLEIDEAIKLCSSERQDPKKKQKYTQGELQILKKVSLLFQQLRMNVFVDRNLIIFRYSHDIDRGRKNSPPTIAKLLTATMTLLQQLAQIVKQKGQISNSFDIEQVQKIDAKIFYLRTLRLQFVGQVYFNNNKIKEAYGLWCECQRCIKILISKEEMNENKSDGFIGCLISLQNLQDNIRMNKCKSIIYNFEVEQDKNDELNKKMKEVTISQAKQEQVINTTLQKLIKENRNECPLSLEQISKVPIIDLPGSLQPMPTRPIFFDIFYLNLTYPSVESKKKKEEPKKSWWGRLFN